MVAGDVIDEARDYSPAFRNISGGEKAPLRALSRVQQAMLSELSKETPEVISTRHEITKNDIDTVMARESRDRSLDIPPFILFLPTVRIGTTLDSGVLASDPVAIVSLADQLKDNSGFPSVAFTDKKITFTDLRFLTGILHGWEEYIGPLTYRYVPLPAYLESPKEELYLPDGLRGAVVQELAVWMAMRLGDTNLATLIQGQVSQTIHHFIDAVRLQERSIPWHVTTRYF